MIEALMHVIDVMANLRNIVKGLRFYFMKKT